jgi:Uma2 family endonuclease
MPTVVLDPPPVELEELIERRRRLGQDRRDEMWDGVLHMNPVPSLPHSTLVVRLAMLLDAPARAAGLTVSAEFNLGEHESQYRIPDLGLHRGLPAGVWVPTAAIAVEILSAGDETWDKLPYYAERGVEELVVVDPRARSVRWLALAAGEYRDVERSALLGLEAAELAWRLDWPRTDESA